MHLVSDWRRVLKSAWSIRFILLAGVLSGLEIVIPYFETAVPPGTFAALSALATGGAFVARIIAQNGVSNDDEK